MKKELLLTIIGLVCIQASAYKQQSIDINVNGQSRNMVVFTPDVLPDNSPLFIVTHGMNQNPEYQYGSDKMYEMIDTAKFVIAYLRSDGSTWDTGGTKDQNFVIKTIDEMASRFSIDTNRVYWSGFSMGSMLIHHCIANMQDKIAAFAPTSGIQFSEQPWNNCKKPVVLLEVIAYGDDVFGYEQYGIHDYIENYAKHDKHTNYKKLTNYKPISSSWFNGDLEIWNGGPNGGEVALYSYNNGGHWPMDLNRHLIWAFCKRYTLDPNVPQVKIVSPTITDVYTQLDTIPIKVHAADTDGTIRSLRIYINGTLRTASQSINEAETDFEYSWTSHRPGTYTIRVVVYDNDNKTKEATRTITIVDLTTYQKALRTALKAAQASYDNTAADTYSSAVALRDKLKDLIDKYTDYESRIPADYESATSEVEAATAALDTRKTNLDEYFAVIHHADSLIALYSDVPAVAESQTFQRLLKARNYYDLDASKITSDSRITSAIKQLSLYINHVENLTVGIDRTVIDRGINPIDRTYTIDGRIANTSHGLVIQQIVGADGQRKVVKTFNK